MATKKKSEKLTVVESPSALGESERKELKRCKDVIRKGLGTFLEVGSALLTIQSKSLYLESHSTFEAFCRAEFEMGRSHAYRLIDSAKVMEDLSSLGDRKLPTNEGQIRILAALPSEERLPAWQKVIDFSSSEKSPITAKLIRKVVDAENTTPQKNKTNPPPAKAPRLTRSRVLDFMTELETFLNSGDIDGAKNSINGFKKGL